MSDHEEAAALVVPYGPGMSAWGSAAQALTRLVGGRWPVDAAGQLALCQLVHLRRRDGVSCWVVDDVAGFAAAAGVRVRGGFVQPMLALDLPEPR